MASKPVTSNPVDVVTRWRGRWAAPKTRLGRVSLYLLVILGCALLFRLLLPGKHAFFAVVAWISALALVPLALVFLYRAFTRRFLWKVRNRLIVTYLLMGLAPVVLFGTLALIVGYVIAGQYAINAALLAIDETADLVKGEISDAAGILTRPEAKGTQDRINFDQVTNPRQEQISMAALRNGTWQTVTLVNNRGSSPPSPFAGHAKPSWMKPGFHGIVVMNGKLYLCRDGATTEDNRSAEALAALELNHAALDSMAHSLGRVLVFSGFSTHAADIDSAERQAQTAEQQADVAQESQDAQREAQQALREGQQERREAQREADGATREAQRELDRATKQLEGVQHAAHPDAEDEADARDGMREAQQSVDEAKKELQSAEQSIPAVVPPVMQAPEPAKRPSVGRGPTEKKQAPRATEQSAAQPSADDGEFAAVSGGMLPASAHLIDPRVYFTAPLPIFSWQSGQKRSALLVVISRPGLLYTRLFATSVDIGSFLSDLLVAMAIGFGVLELLALWMASRLSGTITRSVAGLYRGTTEIDKGNLAYRVRPERPDQLGALANSFNSMAASIATLLVQQRERDRLLNELAIAQEVQQNLFPHSPVSVSTLELHAMCLPARSVSGDYFDFIIGHNTLMPGTGACLALGDISGKGISAALLMASLHSAVRAFSLGEESMTPSPARLLELLNKHLFSSTQSNKYATLFLAFYNAQTRRLTYANGGHLPPFLISADGSVRRLDVGGSVVGLLDHLQYEEATVELRQGDLLLAFTDGLTEPEKGEEEFGEARLLTYLQQHRTESLPAMADGLFAMLQAWIGSQEQPDDMTLLFARQR